MKLKSVSTYCQSAMSAGLIYTRDESGEIIRQHLVCRQMIVPLDGMPVISGDQLPRPAGRAGGETGRMVCQPD